MMASIWCLFSVENQYDQPNNNLVAWWADKPDIATVAETVGLNFPGGHDEEIVKAVALWRGENICHIDTDFRLELIGEGVVK